LRELHAVLYESYPFPKRKRIGAKLGRLLLALSVLLCASCRKSERDETLEWMDNTYNPHENVSGSYGHGRSTWYAPDKSAPSGEFMVSGLKETFTYKGCEMTLRTEDLPEAQKSQEIQSSCKMTFNLRDIDPASIKLAARSHSGDFSCEADSDGQKSIMAENCDHAEMGFKTRNAAGLIQEEWVNVFQKLTGSDHENRHSEKSNSSYFEFDDPEYAKRFAKAFSSAIKLCGGTRHLFSCLPIADPLLCSLSNRDSLHHVAGDLFLAAIAELVVRGSA